MRLQEFLNEVKYDEKYIKDVAKDRGHSITPADAKKAHNYAKKYKNGQDYYDALKDYFIN